MDNQIAKQNHQTAAHSQADMIDIAQDVIPIYNRKKTERPPNKVKLAYDVIMLIAILLDIACIFFDQIVMSTFFDRLAHYLDMSTWLIYYKNHTHGLLGTLGGFFTIFLVLELSMRWLIAIKKRTYYRWFFFPFVHWYEVLGCFPLLRPLRLLRAVVLIRRLHELGINVIPSRWVKSARFYGHVLLEELSDRVILTAIGNLKTQLKNSSHDGPIQQAIDKHRHDLEKVIFSILKQNLIPKIKANLLEKQGQKITHDVSLAIAETLTDIPELSKYLKLIPIAGNMIEMQMVDIGKRIGEKVTTTVHHCILSDELLDELTKDIAHAIAQIDTTDPLLKDMVQNITNDVIEAFETQVKIQQWKHTQYIS